MLCGLRKGVGAVLRSTGRAVDLLGTFFMVNPEFDRLQPNLQSVPFKGKSLQFNDCFIAPNATVIGNVAVGDRSTVWYGAIIRGDVNSIAIGEGSYIGDNAMVHCASEKGDFPTKIGNFVTVKSSAIIHGCILEDNVVVGLGSQVLDGAVMEKGSILSSGSILTGGKRIPAGQVWSGIPAKYVRDVTEEDMAAAQKDLEESIYSAELTALELSKSIEFRSSVEGMLTNKDYGYYFGIQKNPSAVDTENDQLRSADLYGHNVPGRLFETEVSADRYVDPVFQEREKSGYL